MSMIRGNDARLVWIFVIVIFLLIRYFLSFWASGATHRSRRIPLNGSMTTVIKGSFDFAAEPLAQGSSENRRFFGVRWSGWHGGWWLGGLGRVRTPTPPVILSVKKIRARAAKLKAPLSAKFALRELFIPNLSNRIPQISQITFELSRKSENTKQYTRAF